MKQRLELEFENGTKIIFKQFTDDTPHTWMAEYESWHYPFTEDEVQEICAWTKTADTKFERIYKWGLLASGIMRFNDGAYETGYPTMILPFFRSVNVVNLGKGIRLTSR